MMKTADKADTAGVELLDEIEHVLFRARAASRPFTEYLLYMAFLEELKVSGREEATPSTKGRVRKA